MAGTAKPSVAGLGAEGTITFNSYVVYNNNPSSYLLNGTTTSDHSIYGSCLFFNSTHVIDFTANQKTAIWAIGNSYSDTAGATPKAIKLEKYDTATASWVSINTSVATNDTGSWYKLVDNLENGGRYRFLATASYTSFNEWYIENLELKKYLFEDGTDIKKWDTSLTTPAWAVVGTSPVTKAMFDVGMDNLNSIGDSQIKSLVSSFPKLLVWTDGLTNKQSKFSQIPHGKLILPTGDISLGSIEGIDSVSIISNIGGNGVVKSIVSTDKGVTWKTWDTTLLTPTWVIVDSTNLPEVKRIGMDSTTLNARVRADWDSLIGTSTTLRIGYYIEINSSSDVANTDSIGFTVDMLGSWDLATLGTDYTYGYPKNDVLNLRIFNSGDYKINL
jgi:hypothetical protein